MGPITHIYQGPPPRSSFRFCESRNIASRGRIGYIVDKVRPVFLGISKSSRTFVFMSSKKPEIRIRLRRDRLDLLKDMYEIVNRRNEDSGGKRISFNRFMEDMIESFLVSAGGQELCDAVDELRKERSDSWKREAGSSV
jgi:hypothetical protein